MRSARAVERQEKEFATRLSPIQKGKLARRLSGLNDATNFARKTAKTSYMRNILTAERKLAFLLRTYVVGFLRIHYLWFRRLFLLFT